MTRTTFALSLALLGCGASAPDPTTTTADAGFYDALTATPVDAADGALSTITPDAGPNRPDCTPPFIICNGACMTGGDPMNCGACGRVCMGSLVCCGNGPAAFCGSYPDCRR